MTKKDAYQKGSVIQSPNRSFNRRHAKDMAAGTRNKLLLLEKTLTGTETISGYKFFSAK